MGEGTRIAALVAIGFGLTSCSDVDKNHQDYSLPAGYVDPSPRSPFGSVLDDYPPKPDGSAFDLTNGRGVQNLAADLVGEAGTDLVLYHKSSNHSDVVFHEFYPAAQYAGLPGLCIVSPLTVSTVGLYGYDNFQRLERGFGPARFAIAGSVAPISHLDQGEYAVQMAEACAKRRDMMLWYKAEPADALLAARLVDLVVEAARRSARLPFELECELNSDRRSKACNGDARKIMASLEPRAIAEVQNCSQDQSTPCLNVSLAKVPEIASFKDRYQWSLQVQYEAADQLEIIAVSLNSVLIIID